MKVEIRIGNSTSTISGLPTAPFNRLRALLSYDPDPQAAYFSGGYPRKKHLIDKRGTFLTGLLPRVLKFLKDEGLPPSLTDTRVRPQTGLWQGSMSLGTITPYADQTRAVEALLKAGGGQGTLAMVTGYGKSLVIALLIDRLRVKTLCVVPNLELKRQLTESLDEYFGPIAKKWITVENIDSTRLQKLTDFDFLIIDEAHHSAAATYQTLNKTAWKDIYFRSFLTATPFRTNENEQMLLEGIAGKVVYEVSYRKAVKLGAVAPIEAYYYDLPKVSTDAFTWAEVYSELVVNNRYRNELIANTLLTLENEGKSTLCLVKEIKHGEALSTLTGIPFANGQDEGSKRYIDQFKTGKIKALIGTTGVIGEGVDSKPCEFVMIAGLGKAKSAFMQQVGRGIRKFPGKDSAKIILFRDRSHRFCLKHYNAQAKILLEEYGVKPIKL